ncbi:cytochrome P450 [Vreelandella sp. EE22]
MPFGEGGIQGLDGKIHRERKALFLSVMTQARIDMLVQLVQRRWHTRLNHLKAQPLRLLTELHYVLCQAACDWCGIPLQNMEVPRLTQKRVLMIEGRGAVGPKHWSSRRARHQTEDTLIELIGRYRDGAQKMGSTTPFALFADFRDAEGQRLANRVVAVELLNIIRLLVAVARYMVFAVMAAHENPECHEKLKRSDSNLYRRHFIQEDRRYYPFFPLLTALIKKDVTWQGHHFKRGWRVVLDIYGTNHDPGRWETPERFERSIR